MGENKVKQMTAQEAIKAIQVEELEITGKLSRAHEFIQGLVVAEEALEKMAGIERALEQLEEKETELRKARHSLSFEMYENSKAYEKAKVLTQKEITLHEAIEIIKQNCFNT